MPTKKKTKNYWYVLVITSEGAKFVTKVNNAERTAEWDKLEKPLKLSKEYAQQLALGLTWNGNLAYSICQSYEITSQPYMYSKGHLEWKENDDRDNIQ